MGIQTLPKTILAIVKDTADPTAAREDAEGIYGYLPKRALWDALHELMAERFDVNHERGERNITDAIYELAKKYK